MKQNKTLSHFALFFALILPLITVEAKAEESSFKISTADRTSESRDLSGYGSEGVPVGPLQLGGTSKYFSPYVFMVDKKNRVLSLWQDQDGVLKKISAFVADIGKNVENKKSYGDHATPEGIYFMETRLDSPGLNYNLYGSRAFTLNYPNFFDRLEKKTGNGIWLHAVPDNVSLRRGSRGCVVVRNEIVKTLHPYFKPGMTPVIIENEVLFTKPEKSKERQAELSNFLNSWKNSWQEKDIEAYISHYHSDFKSMKMSKSQWKDYKANLNSLYNKITLHFSKPVIYEHEDEAIVRFIQNYQSDIKQDYGEKTLYLKKENGKYAIISEDWHENSSELALQELKENEIVQVCAKSEESCVSTNKQNESIEQASTISK